MDSPRIRWSPAEQAYVDSQNSILASYDALASVQVDLEVFADFNVEELSKAMEGALESAKPLMASRPMASISTSYFSTAVGVYRSTWAANYPLEPDDMLIMSLEESGFGFNAYMVLPRGFTESEEAIRSLVDPILSAHGMYCNDIRFFMDRSDGGHSCELDLIPPGHITVREMAFMVSHLRDLVMNEPATTTPEKVFGAIESGETQFLLGVAESDFIDAKDEHYKKHSRARVEIAADIAAFANSGRSGILVIGARTVRDRLGRDIISEINGCSIDVGARDRYRSAIDTLVYPEMLGVKMGRTFSALGEVFAILIPEQPENRMPFVVRGAIVAGERMSSAVFQVPVRRGDCNAPVRIELIHRRLQSLGNELAQDGE